MLRLFLIAKLNLAGNSPGSRSVISIHIIIYSNHWHNCRNTKVRTLIDFHSLALKLYLLTKF